jgi:hypothetical protein
MKIEKEVIKQIKDIETEDIICDICLESCYVGDSNGHGDHEHLTISGSFGYWSNQKDGEKWEAHVCEKCVDEYLSKMILFNKDLYMGRDKRIIKEMNDPIQRRRKIREIAGLDFEIKMKKENEE